MVVRASACDSIPLGELFFFAVMDNQSIKKNIELYRERSGLTQTDVARRLEMSRISFRNLEKGETRIVNDVIFALAEMFGITPEELLLGYEPQDSGNVLNEDNEMYRKRIADLTEDYESRLAALKRENEELKEFNRTQAEYVRLLIMSGGKR